MPEREQAHHLALAVRERVGFLARPRLGLGGDEPRAERRVDVAPAGGDLAHGRDDLGVRRLLQDVARRAGGERLAHVARVVLHREDEHLRVGRLLEHERHALDPALARA